jgi:hypothetical protein
VRWQRQRQHVRAQQLDREARALTAPVFTALSSCSCEGNETKPMPPFPPANSASKGPNASNAVFRVSALVPGGMSTTRTLNCALRVPAVTGRAE